MSPYGKKWAVAAAASAVILLASSVVAARDVLESGAAPYLRANAPAFAMPARSLSRIRAFEPGRPAPAILASVPRAAEAPARPAPVPIGKRLGTFDSVAISAGTLPAARKWRAVTGADYAALFTEGCEEAGLAACASALAPRLRKARTHAANLEGAGLRQAGNTAVNAALAHFTKALSKQGLVDDVNVNIIHPGATMTERMERLIQQEAAASGVPVEEIRRRNQERAGVRRLGSPDDVAEAVAFLCSPRARHIQGVGIAIDGGATPGL